MRSTSTRSIAMLIGLIVIGSSLLSFPSFAQKSSNDTAKPQSIQLQMLPTGFKFPFSPGSEWHITNGTDRHQSDWNWNAVDFGPVVGSCQGEPVLTTAPGVVEEVSYDTFGGNKIFINHENGFHSVYLHLSTASPLAVGDRVGYGSRIGTCGSTGSTSSGPHIHFQICQQKCNAGPTSGYGLVPVPLDGITDPNRLLSNQRGFFSTNTGVPAYQGESVGQSFQGTMIAGSTQQVQVQLKNTGTATWDGFTRILALPRDGSTPFYDPSWLAHDRIMGAESTPPGSVATFNFIIKAPTTPGQYRIDFAFVQDGVTWFNTPSEGAIGFNVTVTPTVGAGSTRWPLFVEAVDRNGGTATLGYPSMITQWSGPQNAPVQAVIQGFSSGAFIIHDEQRDMPPGSVPAYVLSGPVLQHFQSLQGSSSWLGAGPSSDQFTNTIGLQQSNFPNGYITWDGATAEAHAWPVHDGNQWYAEYHNGTNLNAGATWVQNEASISANWSTNAPGNGQ